MPHCMVYGEIFLYEKPSREQVLDLSFVLTQKAVELRLGLNLFCNLKEWVAKQYDISECLNNTYIPYEILDDPSSNECSEIFKGMLFPHFLGIENSRLPMLQSFVREVVELEQVSHMTIRFVEVHLDDLNTLQFEYTIKANDLCDKLVYLSTQPYMGEFPAVKFTIEK